MNARAIAIQVLSRVRATDAYLNVVLDTVLSESPPADPRDAGLITELTYGATRRQLALDYAITRFADRKLDALEDKVLAALRVGAYQIFYTRVPARAAVAETVQALKEMGLARAAGFVNAILRKLASLPSPPLPPETDLVEHLSVRESHPKWLVERWMRQFGRERAEAMLVANNQTPAVVIRANSAKGTRDALLEQLRETGLEVRPTAVSPVGIVLPPVGRLEDVYGYAEGLWQVQDEAAQLVGVYGDIPETARVLDACAAPGGKACHLAEKHEVVATDLHANKLRKIESEAKRLGLTARLKAEAHDAIAALAGGVGRVPRLPGGRAVLGAGDAAAAPGAALPAQAGGHRAAGGVAAAHPGELPGGGAARRPAGVRGVHDGAAGGAGSGGDVPAQPPRVDGGAAGAARGGEAPAHPGVPAHAAGPRELGRLLRRAPAQALLSLLSGGGPGLVVRRRGGREIRQVLQHRHQRAHGLGEAAEPPARLRGRGPLHPVLPAPLPRPIPPRGQHVPARSSPKEKTSAEGGRGPVSRSSGAT